MTNKVIQIAQNFLGFHLILTICLNIVNLIINYIFFLDKLKKLR